MTVAADVCASPTDLRRDQEVRLPVEYWTVAMDGQDSCGSCDDTLAVLNEAVGVVRPIAARLGIGLELVPRTVATWTDAVGNGIVASPTIRAAGVELRPAHPDGSETRLWQWRGATGTSVPAEAVLDLLVRAVGIRSGQVDDYLASGGPGPYLRQFLNGSPDTDVANTDGGTSQCAPSGCGC